MDKSYRTAGFNILLGHSFGGTFIGYTLLAKPKLFDAYLAVSPAMMYADNYVVKEASAKLKPFKDTKYFYMTVGNEDRYFEALEEYASIMKEKAGESVEFKYVKMLEEDHGTTPYITVFSGLKFIFAGWQLPRELLQEDLETIDSHYMQISLRYGIEVQTPELAINALGYGYLQAEDFDKAIATFKTNVERYPGSANVHDSLGEELRAKGGEYGATTGRARRCGWLDLVSLKHAFRINVFTGIALTKMDVLDGMDKLKVCTSYKYKDPTKNKACKFTDMPQTINVLNECEPVYKEFEGWQKSTKGATKMKDLPKQARAYMDYISEALNVKIDLISTGQKRDEIIFVNKPFKKRK